MKKNLLSLFLFGILLLLSERSQAQLCTACFTATPDSNNSTIINLDASCSNGSPNALYDWYVDGVSYLSFFPVPYFQIPFYIPGQHTIQLFIYDGACIDSAYQIVNIPGCNASFTTNQFGGGLVYFYPNFSWSSSATYNWDYGDGTTSSASSGSHTYAAPGNYTVCCILNTFSGCSDTSCQLITVNTTPNCDANFAYNLNPITGGLYADANFLSFYNANNYSMNWYVNGSLNQTGSFTSYYTTLSTIGLYEVKLVLSDTNMVPCDSISELIYWNGGVVSNPLCHPCFSANFNPTLDSIFFDASCSVIPAGGYLLWNINGNTFPDPGVGFMQGFPTWGYQNVSLFAIDSNNVACDSLFQPVYTYAPPCVSCLTVTQAAASSSDYIFDGSCSGSSTTYSWFIDNAFVTTTNAPQFNYTFTQSGTYSICLQSADANGNYCNQSCTTLVVNTPTVTQYTVSGVIYAADSFYNYAPAGLGDAKVYLIKLITGGILDAIDSTTTDATGRYTFGNKPIDDYRIKVALNPGSTNYSTNIPTYFNSAFMWYNAQVVTLFGNTYNKDIYMNYGTNTGGSGFISGNVFLGSNKPTRSGNADVTLILIDQSTQLPVAYAKTNANGDYNFSNVPYGTYKVFGELLNRASIPDNMVLSAGQASFTNKNFVYNDNVIQPTNMALSVTETNDPINLTIAPNPAHESFNLINSGKSRTVQIMDMTGRMIQQIELMSSERKTIDCRSWNNGMYWLKDNEGGKYTTFKLLIN
jgi:hypothetical protein